MVRTTPDDDHDRKLLGDIQRHGWHLVVIRDDPSVPAYVFSIGMLHTLGHPEICIFGLRSTAAMGQIVNAIGDSIRAGQKFSDWHESTDVLEDYPCMFRRVDSGLYPEYFGYALWFYEGPRFEMLQCVWPDRNNYYPWDSEFDAELVSTQPVLAGKTAWPFSEAKNLGVLTTNRVLDEDHPILLVAHDVDGDWQFLCGTTNEPDDGRIVCLADIVENHPSVAELADLPLGWCASREAVDQPWRRFAHEC